VLSDPFWAEEVWQGIWSADQLLLLLSLLWEWVWSELLNPVRFQEVWEGVWSTNEFLLGFTECEGGEGKESKNNDDFHACLFLS